MNEVNDRGFWRGDTAHTHHGHGHSVELAKWIVNYLSNEKETPIYDLGCGLGFYLQELHKAGFKYLTGYEGEIPHHGKFFSNILQHDITLPLENLPPAGNVICLEVGEHIPGHYQYHFLKNLKNLCKNKLILSWAIQGQGGHGHVHCLNNDEVITSLAKSFLYLHEDSMHVRKSIAPASNTPWFLNTVMIFKAVGDSRFRI